MEPACLRKSADALIARCGHPAGPPYRNCDLARGFPTLNYRHGAGYEVGHGRQLRRVPIDVPRNHPRHRGPGDAALPVGSLVAGERLLSSGPTPSRSPTAAPPRCSSRPVTGGSPTLTASCRRCAAPASSARRRRSNPASRSNTPAACRCRRRPAS